MEQKGLAKKLGLADAVYRLTEKKKKSTKAKLASTLRMVASKKVKNSLLKRNFRR